MTRSSLRATIKDYLDRPNLSDATIDAWLDVVTGDLNVALSAHPRMHTRRMYTLPAGENLLPLPTDMLRLRSLMVGDIALPQIGPTSRPGIQGYIMRGDVAEILPCPTEDVVFAMDYYTTLQEENWVMADFAPVYLYGALTEAAHYLKDMESMQMRQERYRTSVGQLIQQGWNEQLSSGMAVHAI